MKLSIVALSFSALLAFGSAEQHESYVRPMLAVLEPLDMTCMDVPSGWF